MYKIDDSSQQTNHDIVLIQWMTHRWKIVCESHREKYKNIIYFVRVTSKFKSGLKLIGFICNQLIEKRLLVFMTCACNSWFLFLVCRCSTWNTACNQSDVSNILIEVFRGVQLLKGFIMPKNIRFLVVNRNRWQWCWWHRYVGDFMMVTDFRCRWQNHYVGDFFRYVGDFLNVLNRSPTSKSYHQHIWSSTSVSNIDVTPKSFTMKPSSRNAHICL